MRSLKYFLASLMCIASMDTAHAERWWIVVQKSTADDTVLAEQDSLKLEQNGLYTIWTHTFYGKPDGDMHSAKIRYEIRCSDRRIKERDYVDYDASRQPIDLNDNTNINALSPTVNGSTGGKIVDFVCSSDKIRAANFSRIDDAEDYWSIGEFFSDPRPLVEVQSAPKNAQIRNKASGAGRQAFRNYQVCSIAAARRFAKSRETAVVIAEAALTNCRSHRDALVAALASDGRLDADGISKVAMRLDEELLKRVRLSVVETRSSK